MTGIYFKVFDQNYKDNYDEGEVDRTFTSECIFSKTFFDECSIENLLKKATDFIIKHFPVNNDFEISDNKIYFCFPMQSLNSYNEFKNATDEELENWKNGKIDLYNREIVVEFYIINEIESNLLEKVMNDVK